MPFISSFTDEDSLDSDFLVALEFDLEGFPALVRKNFLKKIQLSKEFFELKKSEIKKGGFYPPNFLTTL